MSRNVPLRLSCLPSPCHGSSKDPIYGRDHERTAQCIIEGLTVCDFHIEMKNNTPDLCYRLSRPSFSYRFGLPSTESPGLPEIPREAGLGYPSADVNNDFILTPLLTLPPAFGLAYVGETFSCTFCANNELSLEDKSKSVNSVRIIGEIQTPTKTAPLELEPPEGDAKGSPLGPGKSLQKVVKHELVEEGNHTLAVTVTYSETALAQGEGGISQAIGSKVRTFRKLYQFLAQPCIVIRTKAGELPPSKLEDEKGKNTSGPSLLRYILEAQLENVGEGPVLLDVRIGLLQARLQADVV